MPAWWVMVLAVPAAALAAAAIAAQTYLSMLDHGHAFGRIFAWQFCCWAFWALATPAVLRGGAALRRAPRAAAVWLRLAALGLALIALHLAVTPLLTLWMQPYLPLVSAGYADIFRGQLKWLLPIDVMAFAMLVLIGWAVSVYRRAQQLEVRESRLEADLSRAQLEMLRLEIQPHFLFNTLNAIAALIRRKSDERALDMLVGLSELMRDTLERAPQQLVALEAEVEFTRRAVDLQVERFGDRLRVHFAVDDESRALLVPAFVLQPLVENALRHGVSRVSRGCVIEVGARLEQGEGLHLWIGDDGAGLAAGFTLERDAGVGLRNIRSRLERLYGPAARFSVRARAGGGTIAEVFMPAAAAPSPAQAQA